MRRGIQNYVECRLQSEANYLMAKKESEVAERLKEIQIKEAQWLNRRSQRKSFNWEEFKERLKRFPLPKPRTVKGYSWIYAAGV